MHCKNMNEIVPQRDWSLAVNSEETYPGLSTCKILRIPPHTPGSSGQKNAEFIAPILKCLIPLQCF